MNIIAESLRENNKCKKSSEKLVQLINCRKSFARLTVQISALIDYATPFCKGAFNLEGDADGLAFVTGTEKKIADRITYHDINVGRLKKNANNAPLLVDPLVNEINSRLTEATRLKYEKMLELTNTMELYNNVKQRKDEEGSILVFGDKVTMKRRVGCSQVKGFITGVYVHKLDGTMKYDVTPNEGACHLIFLSLT